jgi:CelD/BcsL family acetyltransferase involved in cellulose biosynthesis
LQTASNPSTSTGPSRVPGQTEGALDLEPRMEDLLARRDERLPFLHPTWLRTWLSEFGGNVEPLFLCAGDPSSASGRTVIGVAPLMRADDRLTFIGDANICDFMDVLVDPDRAGEAYDDLWRQLCAEDWTDIELWGLMAGSATRADVTGRARAAGYGVAEEVEAVSPRLDLPGSWEEYLASLGKKDRHELRRKIRRAFESGADVTFEALTTQDEIVGAMDDFLSLHTGSRADKGQFMTPEMEVFFRRMASAMAAQDLVRLFFLRINRRPAAAVLCFDAGSHLYMYNSGYDPAFSGLSVGIVSKALVLQWAIEHGKRGIDFLRGDEPYKYDLGAKDQDILRLTLRRPAS